MGPFSGGFLLVPGEKAVQSDPFGGFVLPQAIQCTGHSALHLWESFLSGGGGNLAENRAYYMPYLSLCPRIRIYGDL